MYTGYIRNMSQGFKRISKCWINSSYIPVSMTHPTDSSSISPGKTTSKHARHNGLQTKSKPKREKLHRTNQRSSFSNWDNVVNPEKKDNKLLEKKDNKSVLKDDFLTSIAPEFFERLNEISWVFLEINKPLTTPIHNAS